MRILVVEDELQLAEQLSVALRDAGYAVDHAADGEQGEFLGRTEGYDAVILDLGLPKMDGLTVLRQWRDSGLAMPVLVLTARGSWHEKVQGIDGGADDYVAKPFQIEEVLARLRALIRRSSGQVTPELRAGGVVLDPRGARVTVDGAPVKLTAMGWFCANVCSSPSVVKAMVPLPTSTFTPNPATSQNAWSASTREGSSTRRAARPTTRPVTTTAITGEAWKRSATSDVPNSRTVDASTPVR